MLHVPLKPYQLHVVTTFHAFPLASSVAFRGRSSSLVVCVFPHFVVMVWGYEIVKELGGAGPSRAGPRAATVGDPIGVAAARFSLATIEL